MPTGYGQRVDRVSWLIWAHHCQLSFSPCFILRTIYLTGSGLTLVHPLSGPVGGQRCRSSQRKDWSREGVARGPGGLTLWNECSGDSGRAGLGWTACWTASSSEGGCGWGCFAGSCFPLLLQHSSQCWGNACGCCKSERPRWLPPGRSAPAPGRLTNPGTSVLVLGKLACDSHPHSLSSLLWLSAFPTEQGGDGELGVGEVLVSDPKGNMR